MQETQEMQVKSLGWEDSVEEDMETHAGVLPGKFPGQWSLAGDCPWIAESWILLSY